MESSIDIGKGHRERLRARYMRGGIVRMEDDEILELLLTWAIPRRDVKLPARRLIDRFGSLRAVFEASDNELSSVSGIGPSARIFLKLVHALCGRVLEGELKGRPLLSNSELVHSWLRANLGHRDRECFVVLMMNARNELIDDRMLFEGTVNETAVYPREVVRAALNANATGIILAHNHPGGTPRASSQDVALTRRICSLAETFGIRLHDHLVVTRTRCLSLRETVADAFSVPA